LKKKQMQEQRDYLQAPLESRPSVPQGINVLTILSFIGSGFQVFGAIVGYFLIVYSVKSLPETRKMERSVEMKPFSSFFKWSADATLKQYEYRVWILVISLFAAALCIVGAIQMRKRKKIGFTVYTAGELMLPLFTAVVIDIWSSLFGMLVAVVFIVLFAVQRKHLTQ
jgi:hypothetical protein